MKITRSQLKRIIKEEMQRTLLTESIDIKSDYPNIHEQIVLPLQCEIVKAHSTSGLNIDCGVGGPSNEDWFDAETNEGNHNNEKIIFEIPDSVWPQSKVEEIFADQNNYPNGFKLIMTPPTVPDDDMQKYVMVKDDDSPLRVELKALAIELASARKGSYTLEIIPGGVTSGGGGYRQRSEIDID